jgi:Lon protease-like protein
VSLHVFEERYVRMCAVLEDSDGLFASVLIERGSEVGGNDKRSDVGVLIQIDDLYKDDGRILLIGHAEDVITVIDWLDDDPYPQARCKRSPQIQCDDDMRDSHFEKLVNILRRIGNTPSRELCDLIVSLAKEDGDTELLLREAFWATARLLPAGAQDRRTLLYSGDISSGIRSLAEMMTHFEELTEFQKPL